PGRRSRPRRVESVRRGRLDLRPARPERRRQVDDGQDPDDAVQARLRQREHPRARRPARPRPGSPHDRVRRAALWPRPRGDGGRGARWDEISRLATDEGLTILLTTPYLEEADRLVDRLAIVDRGRVVAEGTPDELKGELQGDALHIELGEPQANGRVYAALEPLGDVRELRVDGRTLHARVADGARAVPVVLQALEAQGIPVASATVARPSLDD